MKTTYIDKLLSEEYYRNLVIARDLISQACDDYFRLKNGKKVDLYLISNCASSPMGKGSDSEPLFINFGDRETALVDSSQFGLEVMVLKHFDLVYCYLPSFRGEKPDSTHLNQFFHCEAEIKGDFTKNLEIATGLVKYITDRFITGLNAKAFNFDISNYDHITRAIEGEFPSIKFDDAITVLSKLPKSEKYYNSYPYGKNLTRKGEKKLVEIITKNKTPLWVTHFDRDIVPFYQKPDPENKEKVLSADLLVPEVDGGYGGEIMGAGQRQDNIDELYESMKRQEIKTYKEYDWYLKLRENREYKTTSGFGLGIERLLAWMICKESIADVILFPRTLNGSLNP